MLLNTIPVLFINLERRADRKISVLNELKKIGVTNPTCFKGIDLENGALGCAMSHLKCVETAKKNNYEYVFICEDDIEFLDAELFLKQLNIFWNSNISWDVVLVAGNNMLPYIPINDNCIKIVNCQTTTGYIVQQKYYDKLIDNFKTGIKKLLKEPNNNFYKIDKHWFKLQRDDNWYLIIPLTIVQKDDYSDIEKKYTNFKNFMLDYNKAYKK